MRGSNTAERFRWNVPFHIEELIGELYQANRNAYKYMGDTELSYYRTVVCRVRDGYEALRIVDNSTPKWNELYAVYNKLERERRNREQIMNAREKHDIEFAAWKRIKNAADY